MVSVPSEQEHSNRSSRTEANDRAPEPLLRATQSATRALTEDSDLTAIIDAWDGLPEAVRASILMLVKASSRG
jgi:hypothetical protein